MKTPRMLLVITALLLAACQRESAAPDTGQSFQVVNVIAQQRLGVSLGALSVLADWSPNSYRPKAWLQTSTEMVWIRELERAGYLRVHDVQGLPDGSIPDEPMITLEPIGRGMEIVAAFQASM